MDKTKSRKSWIVIGVIAAVVLAIGAVAFLVFRTPRVPYEDPVGLTKYVASDHFHNLSDADKRKCLDQLMKDIPSLIVAYGTGKISDEDRNKAIRNIGPTFLYGKMDDYFALKTDQERTAYVDQIIAQQMLMEQMAKASGKQNRGQWGSASTVRQMTERMPPRRRIEVAQFFAAVAQRRGQLGLPIPKPPK